MVLEKRVEGGDKLTDPNIPASPDSGEIRYFDSIQPALKQGDYEINLSQDFRERVRRVLMTRTHVKTIR